MWNDHDFFLLFIFVILLLFVSFPTFYFCCHFALGYGHIAPKTYLGKISTIFYAILGIPLMLLCLSNIGDIMASSFRYNSGAKTIVRVCSELLIFVLDSSTGESVVSFVRENRNEPEQIECDAKIPFAIQIVILANQTHHSDDR